MAGDTNESRTWGQGDTGPRVVAPKHRTWLQRPARYGRDKIKLFIFSPIWLACFVVIFVMVIWD